MERPLNPGEAALWARVLETVRPLKVAPKPVAKVAQRIAPVAAKGRHQGKAGPDVIRGLPGSKSGVSGSSADRATHGVPVQAPNEGSTGSSTAAQLFQKLLDQGVGSVKAKRAPVSPYRQPLASSEAGKAANTLDGSWDKKLARGLISPDTSIDLHGHNLSTAYATLDGALEQSIRLGDRVVLLVTGKPPRPESERPHARGAIRSAIGDWLAGSRHAAAIAAVRNAHPRHGGAGALYIILRRTDPNRFY